MKFDKVFGFHRTKSLMADREFICQKWFHTLEQNNIPYYIRMKDNTLLPYGKKVIMGSKG